MCLAAAKEISVDAAVLSALAGIFSPYSKTNKDKRQQRRIFSELSASRLVGFDFRFLSSVVINVYFNYTTHTSRSPGAGAKLAGRYLTGHCNKWRKKKCGLP